MNRLKINEEDFEKLLYKVNEANFDGNGVIGNYHDMAFIKFKNIEITFLKYYIVNGNEFYCDLSKSKFDDISIDCCYLSPDYKIKSYFNGLNVELDDLSNLNNDYFKSIFNVNYIKLYFDENGKISLSLYKDKVDGGIEFTNDAISKMKDIQNRIESLFQY